MINRILRIAAFQNPEFYKAQAMRLSTFGKPRIISCGEDFARHIAVPRGCIGEVLELLNSHGIPSARSREQADPETKRKERKILGCTVALFGDVRCGRRKKTALLGRAASSNQSPGDCG